MACAQVPLDEQQVTELGPQGKEHTLPALVSYITLFCTEIHSNSSLWCTWNNNLPHRPVHQNHTLCFYFTPAPNQEGRSLFCALQAPARRRLSH